MQDDPKLSQLYAETLARTAQRRRDVAELKAAVVEVDPNERAAKLRAIRERLAMSRAEDPGAIDTGSSETGSAPGSDDADNA